MAPRRRMGGAPAAQARRSEYAKPQVAGPNRAKDCPKGGGVCPNHVSSQEENRA
jgi:hypothetical protein